jgi:hypothetical protein
VSFRPEALRGAPSGGLPVAGQVTYRLARNAVVGEFQKGRLSRLDVCDAHPELVRAARSVGEGTTEPCPICEEANVVLVSYAFGPGLPASGKLVTTRTELARAGRVASGDVACYVVEVCPGCSWNHLAQTFVVSGGPGGRGARGQRTSPMMRSALDPLVRSTERAEPSRSTTAQTTGAEAASAEAEEAEPEEAPQG